MEVKGIMKRKVIVDISDEEFLKALKKSILKSDDRYVNNKGQICHIEDLGVSHSDLVEIVDVEDCDEELLEVYRAIKIIEAYLKKNDEQ